jgi:hypothetical protein
MAKKCYRVDYVNCNNVAGTEYLCSESIVYVSSGGNCGGNGIGGYFLSADLGFTRNNASELSGSATIVDCALCAGCNCGGIASNQPYDCVNGGCVPKTTYNTPGVYATLAACQSGCAKNSNCTGECVSSDEIAALQQAANNLQARLCK